MAAAQPNAQLRRRSSTGSNKLGSLRALRRPSGQSGSPPRGVGNETVFHGKKKKEKAAAT
jgi:hypothetical protein